MLRYAGFEAGVVVAGFGGIAGLDDQNDVIGSSGLRGGNAGDEDGCCGRAGSVGGAGGEGDVDVAVAAAAAGVGGERSSCCSRKISFGILFSVFRKAAPDAATMMF